MNIGTAKPNASIFSDCPHHLIDIIDPTDHYSVAKFRTDAKQLTVDIKKRGNIPVLSGGTMLYYKALKDGLSELPGRDHRVRESINTDIQEFGLHEMHKRLMELDPASAKKINPNDSQRIQRAIEVFELTGTPMSKTIGQSIDNEEDIDSVDIALIPSSRSTLYEKINDRFEKMLNDGLIDEVEKLKHSWNLSPDLPSMRCVGYRQVWEYLEGSYDRETLFEKGAAASRQLAKRQLTWLRGFELQHRFDPFHDGTFEKIKIIVENL